MVVSLAQGLLAFFGSSLGLFLLGFGATFVGLVPSSFLRARVSGYCCNVCVGHYTCSEFYLSSVWGVLISFWSVLVFFFGIFFGFSSVEPFARVLLRFLESLFSVFSSEVLVLFCCRLRLLPIRVCWPVRLWSSRFFSMPSTRPLLYNRSADLLPAPPFSGDSVGLSAVTSGPFDFAFQTRWQ